MQIDSRRLAAAAYLGLILLQPLWHWLAPAPMGMESWLLALIATLPLLLPARGVMQGSLRSLTWAGYLLMLYLAIGIMEAWSNPPQRIPALAQTFLVIGFLVALLIFSRKDRPQA